MFDPTKVKELTKTAVQFYWETRNRQTQRQQTLGGSDQGARAAATGGAQLDSFMQLIEYLALLAEVPPSSIFKNRAMELPGYFRPTKEWDFLVVHDKKLLAAVEAKSQVGPSFGNNFNNRTEEAMGSATDVWTAYREGAFKESPRPWLGYLFLLEDCPKSRKPVKVAEPHFEVFPEFKGASYAKRYELFCRKLVRERLYDEAAFMLSSCDAGVADCYCEPAEDLTMERFARSFIAHLGAFAK